MLWERDRFTEKEKFGTEIEGLVQELGEGQGWTELVQVTEAAFKAFEKEGVIRFLTTEHSLLADPCRGWSRGFCGTCG